MENFQFINPKNVLWNTTYTMLEATFFFFLKIVCIYF